VGESPWRFKSSHPHSQIRRFRCPISAQTAEDQLDTSDWMALAAVAITVVLWWFERRSRRAEVAQERTDRSEQLKDEHAHREEQLRLTRMQVEADLADREAKRREEQAAAEQAERDRRTPIRVGGHIVAEELRANAEVARRSEEGSHVPSETQHIRLFDWWGRRGEMAGLRDEDSELWSELEQIYAALEQSKQRGDYPGAPRLDHVQVVLRTLGVAETVMRRRKKLRLSAPDDRVYALSDVTKAGRWLLKGTPVSRDDPMVQELPSEFQVTYRLDLERREEVTETDA
jgi:hypothetical protein